MWILADSPAIATKKKLIIPDLPDMTGRWTDLRKPEGRMSEGRIPEKLRI
ncbi:MAG: hypothetical protein LH628_16080 [Microcoleus sp. CAN_BIN18]|nr:hypothetical protein [Microcoleus sp. CAN_BIN18]